MPKNRTLLQFKVHSTSAEFHWRHRVNTRSQVSPQCTPLMRKAGGPPTVPSDSSHAFPSLDNPLISAGAVEGYFIIVIAQKNPLFEAPPALIHPGASAVGLDSLECLPDQSLGNVERLCHVPRLLPLPSWRCLHAGRHTANKQALYECMLIRIAALRPVWRVRREGRVQTQLRVQ
jgi:hypothetical protein